MIEERIIKPGLMKRLFRRTYPVKVELTVYDDEYEIPNYLESRRDSWNSHAVKVPKELLYDFLDESLTDESKRYLDDLKSEFTEIREAKVRQYSPLNFFLYLPVEKYKNIPDWLSIEHTTDSGYYAIELLQSDLSYLVHKPEYSSFTSQFDHLVANLMGHDEWVWINFLSPMIKDDILVSVSTNYISNSDRSDIKSPERISLFIPKVYRIPEDLSNKFELTENSNEFVLEIYGEFKVNINVSPGYTGLTKESKEFIDEIIERIISNKES